MTTHSDYSKESYPANKSVLKELKGVKGHLLCRIYWASNLKDGVCRMGLTRLGEEVGFERSTISKAAKALTADGYIKQVKPADPAEGQPAHYQVTQKFYDLLTISLPVDVINTPVDKVNTPVDDINKDIEPNIEPNINTTTTPAQELCKHFEDKTGKTPHAIIQQQNWEADCQDIIELCGGLDIALLQADNAVSILIRGGYSFNSPASLINTITKELAEKKDK